MVSTPVLRTAVLLAQAVSGEKANLLDNVKTVFDIIGTAVTAAALIIGGIWAYFKFVKGRTYRPRLEIGLSGQWRLVDGKHLLHARITVKNIGASKVTLLQRGTGLGFSVLAPDQPLAPASASWERLSVSEILGKHQWIEPEEAVSDDLLLDLGLAEPEPTLFEARLVWRWSKRSGNIVIFARRIIPVEATIDGHEESVAAAGGQGRGANGLWLRRLSGLRGARTRRNGGRARD